MASIGHASIWGVAGSIGSRGLSFILFMLIAKQLGPTLFGIMAIALAFSALLDAFIDGGLSDQIIRYSGAESEKFISNVFFVQCCISFFLLLTGCLVIAPLGGYLYDNYDVQIALIGVCIASAFTGIGLVPTTLLAKRFDQKSIAKRNFFSTLCSGCFGLILAYQGKGIWALVITHVLNAAIGAVMSWWSAGWRPQIEFQINILNQVKEQAFKSFLTRVIDNFMGKLDHFLIGLMLGANVLGFYALAIRLYDVLFQMFCMPIASIMLSYMAKHRLDIGLIWLSYGAFLKSVSLIIAPIFLIATIFIPVSVPLFFGVQWAEAAECIAIVLFAGILQAISFTHTPTFTALGKNGLNLLVSTVATCAWLVGLYIFSSFGLIAAAYLWLFKAVVGFALQTSFMHYYVNFTLLDYIRKLSYFLISSIVFSALCVIFFIAFKDSDMFVMVVFGGLVFAIVFYGVVALIFSTELQNFIKKIIFKQGSNVVI